MPALVYRDCVHACHWPLVVTRHKWGWMDMESERTPTRPGGPSGLGFITGLRMRLQALCAHGGRPAPSRVTALQATVRPRGTPGRVEAGYKRRFMSTPGCHSYPPQGASFPHCRSTCHPGAAVSSSPGIERASKLSCVGSVRFRRRSTSAFATVNVCGLSWPPRG